MLTGIKLKYEQTRKNAPNNEHEWTDERNEKKRYATMGDYIMVPNVPIPMCIVQKTMRLKWNENNCEFFLLALLIMWKERISINKIILENIVQLFLLFGWFLDRKKFNSFELYYFYSFDCRLWGQCTVFGIFFL